MSKKPPNSRLKSRECGGSLFKAFFPNHEEQAELIVNIEAQNNFNPGYSLVTRGVYYCARMLSAQKEQGFVGSNYGGLKKVYSVWICMHPTKEWESTITTYKITEESTAGFPKEDKSAYDKLQVAKVCLGERDADNPKKLLRILETLFSSDLPASEKLEMLEQEGIDCESLESEVSEMCNYSKGVREEGIQQGIQQGMQQGMQQGKQRGKLEAILALRETMLNVDLNKIMDMLKIPQGDRAFYLDEIKKLEEKQDK